jgi:hypothetical protein
MALAAPVNAPPAKHSAASMAPHPEEGVGGSFALDEGSIAVQTSLERHCR